MIDNTATRRNHLPGGPLTLGCARDQLACWIGAYMLALICGCGPRGPAVELVEGIVLLDGKPVEGATVFFSPVPVSGEARSGLPAAGRTGPDGAFRLNAGGGAEPGAGTTVGDYVVTVVKQESDPLPPPDPNKPAPPPPVMTARDLLPERYKLGATSPLRATVKEGRNVYRFEIESEATAPLVSPRK